MPRGVLARCCCDQWLIVFTRPHPWGQRVEAEALRLQSEMALALAEGRRAMDERVAQAFEEAQARATAAISERAGGCGCAAAAAAAAVAEARLLLPPTTEPACPDLILSRHALSGPTAPPRSCAGAAEGELAQQAEALGAESVRQVAVARAEAEKTVQV